MTEGTKSSPEGADFNSGYAGRKIFMAAWR